MKLQQSALTLALATLCASVAAQTVYRWTDADGKVHYTDSPPPASARESRTVTTDAAADQRAVDALREQNAALAKRTADRNKTPEEREREKKEADRKLRCGSLLNIVNAFERGDPVFRETDKGKVELKGAEREAERLRSSKQFQLECQDLAKEASVAAARQSSSNAGRSAGGASPVTTSSSPSRAGGSTSSSAPPGGTGNNSAYPGSTASPSAK